MMSNSYYGSSFCGLSTAATRLFGSITMVAWLSLFLCLWPFVSWPGKLARERERERAGAGADFNPSIASVALIGGGGGGSNTVLCLAMARLLRAGERQSCDRRKIKRAFNHFCILRLHTQSLALSLSLSLCLRLADRPQALSVSMFPVVHQK